MNPTKNDLKESVRSSAAAELNHRLADLIDLRLQAKQAHWNVKGPHFIGLHHLFDGVFEAVEPTVDDVAERIAALGGVVEGTLEAVSCRTALSSYPLKATAGRAHVAAMSDALAKAAAGCRKSIDKLAEFGDAGSADLLTQAVRELDKQLWFVETHLQGES